MKTCVTIFFLLWFPVFGAAQSQRSQLDSIFTLLKNVADDTMRMQAYSSLGSLYDDVNLDSSIFYGDKGAAIASELDLKLNEAESLARMSWPLGKTGNYPRAFKLLNQALEIATKPSSEKKTWGLLQGQTPHAYRLKVLTYIHSGLGGLYGYTGNYERQIVESFEAVNIALALKDSLQLALIYPDIGAAYLRLNRLDSAIFFEKLALVCYSGISPIDQKYSGEIYLYLGEIYQQKGNINLAKENFERSIQVSDTQNNLTKKGNAHFRLASLYESLKKPDSSLYHAQKALAAFTIVGNEKSKAVAYRMISDCYFVMGEADSALTYSRLSTVLNDSLDKIEIQKLREFQVAGFEETLRLQEMEKEKVQTQNNIKSYTMLTGLGLLLIIGLILYRNNRQKQKANKILEATLANLKATQSQLIQSEKMASLGELTAGIAHEIQNPLNFVNNFSEINSELIKELKEEAVTGNMEEVTALANDIQSNSEKINHHGKRADAIVKGMLQHSRTSVGVKQPTDINKLVDEYLRLAYHGLRAKDKSFNATLNTSYDENIGEINIVPQDIGRVILNLINNAFYAVRAQPLKGSNGYQPTVTITTGLNKPPLGGLGAACSISIADNGNGIPQNIIDKIFQPFFTTKPTGQGTGLGLSLAYDIIKAHGGELTVESKEGEGCTFMIILPIV